MDENEDVKSKRDQLMSRLKAKYPDKEYSDDEALMDQINADYDEYDGKINDYKEREDKFVEMLNKDPRSAQFITDMAQGKDPIARLINRIGIDGVKEMLEDPDKLAEYSANNKEYLERLSKEKSLEQEWEKNMSSTLQMLEQLQSELGLSDEQIDAAADWIKAVVNDAVLGIIKRETIEMALKAINYDKDVEAASNEGEIRGKNAKIEAKMRKGGDTLPALGGGNNTAVEKRGKKSIFDLASEA